MWQTTLYSMVNTRWYNQWIGLYNTEINLHWNLKKCYKSIACDLRGWTLLFVYNIKLTLIIKKFQSVSLATYFIYQLGFLATNMKKSTQIQTNTHICFYGNRFYHSAWFPSNKHDTVIRIGKHGCRILCVRGSDVSLLLLKYLIKFDEFK